MVFIFGRQASQIWTPINSLKKGNIKSQIYIITTIYNVDLFQKMLLLEIPVSPTGNVAELNFRLSVPTVFVNVSLDIYSSIDSAFQVIEHLTVTGRMPIN